MGVNSYTNRYLCKNVFVKEVLEQPGSETHVHNVVTIRELCHTNDNKQSRLLADVDVSPPRGAV